MFSFRGAFQRGMASGAQGGLAGFSAYQKRFYKSYEVLMMPPNIQPENEDAADAAVHNYLSAAYEQGFFNRKLDRDGTPILRIISGPEFAYNGYRDADGNRIISKYDASKPVTTEVFKRIMDKFASYANQIDSSVVVCPGTAVVDTGERTEDGKRVIENRSMLMQGTFGLSGEDAQDNIVAFSKELLSNIDLPKDAAQNFSFRSGSGPILVSIKDFSGGADGVIAVAICLDAINLGKLPFPIEPQAVFNPSAGSPDVLPFFNADLVVIDATRAPWNSDAIMYSRAYAPKQGLKANYPGIASLIDNVSTVAGRGIISDAIQTFFRSMILKPNEQFDTMRRFEPLQNRIVKSQYGQDLVITPERPLPEIDDSRLAALKARLRNPAANISILFPNGTTVSSDPMTPDAPIPGEGPEGFDPNKVELHDELAAMVAVIKPPSTLSSSQTHKGEYA